MAGVLDDADERPNHAEHHGEFQHRHDQDSHGQDSHNQDNAEHSGITASYRFNCEDADAIRSVSTALFAHFADIKQINTLWVTARAQGAKMINADNNTLFTKVN